MTDIVGLAGVKTGSNPHEWLTEIEFVTSEMRDPSEPQTFQQVWWHPDLEAREKWHDGIRLEFNKWYPWECGEKWDDRAFQVQGGWLDAVGYSKSKQLQSIKPDW